MLRAAFLSAFHTALTAASALGWSDGYSRIPDTFDAAAHAAAHGIPEPTPGTLNALRSGYTTGRVTGSSAGAVLAPVAPERAAA